MIKGTQGLPCGNLIANGHEVAAMPVRLWPNWQWKGMLSHMTNMQPAPGVQAPTAGDAAVEEQPRPVSIATDADVKAAIARVAQDHVELLTELANR
jgi:hypothetical protein